MILYHRTAPASRCAMRGVALTLRQPTLPLRQGRVPRRGEGVDKLV